MNNETFSPRSKLALGVIGLALLVLSAVTTFRTVSTQAEPVKAAKITNTTMLPETTVEIPGLVLPEAKAPPLVSKAKQVKNVNLPVGRTLFIYGAVSFEALQTAKKITKLQLESAEPIFLVITSPGGSVLTGAAVISAIQASRAPVYTVCSVLCASMGAMIHAYGKERYMTDRSILMFHPASSGTQGDVDRMASYTGTIKRFVNKLELDVATRAGISFDKYKAMSAIELWIDSEDATNAKFNDKIVSLLEVGDIYQNPSLEDKTKTYSYSKKALQKLHPNDVIWILETN